MTHTAGPWTIEAAPEYAHLPCGGKATVNTTRGIQVAVVYDVDSADARLIAAAPELLRACQLLLEWSRKEKDARHPTLTLGDVEAAAEYAVLKVTD